jgi:hypothetical protein
MIFTYRLVSFGEMRILRTIARTPKTAEDRLHEMADWQYARLTATAKGCVGTGVAFLAALLTTQLKNTLAANNTVVGIAAASAFVVIAFGLYVYFRLRRYNELYAQALDKLRRLHVRRSRLAGGSP